MSLFHATIVIMKDKTFISLSVLFFILFFLGIALVGFEKPLLNTIFALNENPDTGKCFGVIFPFSGTAGDENSPTRPTKIRVTVVIRDKNNKFLSNRPIRLVPDLSSVTVSPTDTQNTANGQAVFEISSSRAGTVHLKAIDLNSKAVIEKIPSAEFTE